MKPDKNMMNKLESRLGKIGMVVQARMGSTRLPGKVLTMVQGKELLRHLLERVALLGLNGRFPVIVATTDRPEDRAVAALAESMGCFAFRGSETDIGRRFIDAAERFGLERLVRLQGDDPLVSLAGIAAVMQGHEPGADDLTTCAHRKGWILGTASMVIELEALKKAHSLTEKRDPAGLHAGFVPFDSSDFHIKKIRARADQNRTDIFLTVDYPEDLKIINDILAYFITSGQGCDFDNPDIIRLFDEEIIKPVNQRLHEPFDE